MATVASDWFLRRFTAIFEKHVIANYYSSLAVDPQTALKTLHDEYTVHFAVVKFIGDKLNNASLTQHFTVTTRCALLQSVNVSSTRCLHKEQLLGWLRSYGQLVLEHIETEGVVARDDVFQALHLLTIAATHEVKSNWEVLLGDVIRQKAAVVVEDLTELHVSELLQWKERVVEPFCRMALCRSERDLVVRSDLRAHVDDWSQHCETLLLDECGRKLIGAFFSVIVDFPDSKPALKDLRLCMRRGSTATLRKELVTAAKKILATKLHHPGVRTEDILTILVATIRSFCTLFSKNEQGPVVLDVISDTLMCLQRRKDSVSALVLEVTQASAGSGLFGTTDEQEGDHDDSDDDTDDANQPNALNVLLSTLNLNEVVKEYKMTLAESIFQKADYDCTAETEVLERMKRAFGEEALSSCDVMLRDVQQSRRVSTWIRDQRRRTAAAAAAAATTPQSSSATEQTTTSSSSTTCIISHTCWPDLDFGGKDASFLPHPSLQGFMDTYTKDFQSMKPNQTLQWLPYAGFVKLKLTQRSAEGPVTNSHRLPIAVATVVLHLSSDPEAVAAGGVLSFTSLCAKMKAKEPFVKSAIQPFLPSLLVVADGGSNVALQKDRIGQNQFAFQEEANEGEAPQGMSAKDIEKFGNVVFAMLKTGGKRTAKQILNSMKMLGGYTGSPEELAQFLAYLVSKGKIASTDMVNFTVKK